MALITQAFVLGAGLGTRLRPLTYDLPKPLIPIFQKPLITFALDHLIDLGVKSFVINTHQLPERFDDFFPENIYAGHPVKLLHEPDLLETGGGIKNAEAQLGDQPFIVYSGDILTDIDLQPLIEEHFQRGNDVTLALRKTKLGSDIVLREGRVVDIAGKYGQVGEYDLAGVSVWNSSIFEKIPPGKKISFIPIVAEWIGQNGKIGGVVLNERQWFNIGSRTQYLEVHRAILEQHWKPRYVKTPEWPAQIAPDAKVDPSVRLSGFYSIGAGCTVGTDALIEDTILWPGSQIASRSELVSCIVRSRQKVEGVHRNIDL
jgi:mannose-1-phosphate guanylyltransferase